MSSAHQKLSAKLDLEKVTKIKALIWEGYTQASVAEAFGVTQTTVNRIVHGRAYTYVPWPDGAPGALNLDGYIKRMESLGLRRKTGTINPVTLKPAMPTYDLPLDMEEGEAPGLTEEQKKAAEDRVNRLAVEAETHMELETASKIKASAKAPRKRGPKKPPKEIKYKQLPWSDVQSLASRNPMVILAMEDKNLRKCVCIAFQALPQEMWNTPKAEQVVKQVGRSLGIEIKGNFFRPKE